MGCGWRLSCISRGVGRTRRSSEWLLHGNSGSTLYLLGRIGHEPDSRSGYIVRGDGLATIDQKNYAKRQKAQF